MSMTDRYHDILRALADGEERHGYAILEAVEEHTNGKVILAPGTLYRAIGRLLDDGLIVQTDRRPDPAVEDERRRYYRITPQGAEALRTPGMLPLPCRTTAQQQQYDVLCALADGAEHHAYGLITDVRAAHNGAVRVGTGTAYRALDGLLADGLVVETGERPDPAVNPHAPRRHFRSTPRGEDARQMLAALPPHQPRRAVPWRGAVSFGVTWGAATGGLLLLLGAGGAGWATGAVATVVTTGAGLLRRAEAA